jgi:hypothetical protein
MEYFTVEQVIARLQSAVEALMVAQNYFNDQDPKREVDITLIKEMVQSIDDDAWAIADEVETSGLV